MHEVLTKTWPQKDFRADAGERSVVAMISTDVVDRDGDVVLPKGMDATEFRANPVVMFKHGLAESAPLPVATGQAKRVAGGIMGKATFAKRPAAHPPQAEWLPDTIFDLYQQGVLRAFSIGFSIEKARMADDSDRRRFGDKVFRVIEEWKLIEFSVVPVPANQDAIATAVSKGLRANLVTQMWGIDTHRVPVPLILDPTPIDIGADN